MNTRSKLGHGRMWGLLRLVLAAGALYDLCFAALMVLAPEPTARILRLPMPGESFYLWLIAVFLVMLAAFYLLAAYDPVSYRGNVAVAILGRLAGALVFLLAAFRRPDLQGLYALAAGDLAFCFLTAFCWWPLRKPGLFRP